LHNEICGDEATPVPDRIMKKTGLCSSGGQGSQDRTAGMAQHTANQGKPVGELV